MLKVIAFTFRGFWESKRNRIDLLITLLGICWIAVHYIVAFPIASLRRFTYTFGYMVVIMRFFTIAGLFCFIISKKLFDCIYFFLIFNKRNILMLL